jgi:threonine dehydrogenase-like Zn-dependent dehydrogenase
LALTLLSDAKIPWISLVTHTLPLPNLRHAFDLMMTRKALKVALVP